MDGVAVDVDFEGAVALQGPDQTPEREACVVFEFVSDGHRCHHDGQVRVDRVLGPVWSVPEKMET